MGSVSVAGAPVTMLDLESCLGKAVAEVLATMLNYQAIVVPRSDNRITPGLSAIVGFGGKISGFIALHLTLEGACTLASGLLGMGFDEVDDIVSDAMGEVVNMLAGGLKKYACQSEELFKISIPSVIRGNDYSTHAPKDSEQRILSVQAGPCSLTVQLVVEQH